MPSLGFRRKREGDEFVYLRSPDPVRAPSCGYALMLLRRVLRSKLCQDDGCRGCSGSGGVSASAGLLRERLTARWRFQLLLSVTRRMPMKRMKEIVIAQTTWMIRREAPVFDDAAAHAPTGTIEDSNRVIVFDMVASSSTLWRDDRLRSFENPNEVDAVIEQVLIRHPCLV